MKKTISISWLLAPLLLLTLNACKSSKKTSGSPSFSSSKATDRKEDRKQQKIDYFFIKAATENMKGNPQEAIALYKQALEIDPDFYPANFEVARLSLMLGDPESAIKYGKKALQRRKDNEWYYIVLSQAYTKQNQADKATATLREAEKNFPQNNDIKFELAHILLLQQKLEEAIQVYDKIEKQAGINEDVSLRKQQIYLKLNQPDKAILEVNKLIQIYPNEPRYYQAKYDIYLLNSQTDSAISILKKILLIDPDNALALFSLSDYYRSTGNDSLSQKYLYRSFENPAIDLEAKLRILAGLYPIAIVNDSVKTVVVTLFKKLETAHPPSPLLFAIKADIFRVNQQTDSAARYYRISLAEDPTNVEVWEQLLGLQSREANYKMLEKDAEKALEYFPNEPSFLYFLGVSATQNKNYEAATYALEKLKKIEASNPIFLIDLYSQLGTVYNTMGEYEKSDKNYEAALQIDPNNDLILNNYAYFLSLRGESLEKAEKMILKALQKQPGTSAYQDTYGWILYLQGKYTEAEKWILKSINNGGEGEVYEHYGDIWLKLGDKQKAIEYWKKAIETGSDETKVQEKINQASPK